MPNEQAKRDHRKFIAWAMRHAAHEPLAVRCAIYRVIAEVCGDQQDRANLLALTQSLESTDELSRKFVTDYETKHAASS